MSDTSWEESQKRSSRFRPLIWLLIILVIAAVVGIVVFNNRDYLSGSASSGGETGSREVFSADGKGPVKPGVEGSIPATPVSGVKKSKPETPLSEVRQKQRRVSPGTDSVTLKDIVCRVMDRNDIRVRLTVGLIFRDPEMRREVLVRREAMAAMVQRTLKTMALDDVKIDKLEPMLIKEMNGVFGKSIFSDIAINNISVEKVNSE